MNKIILTLISIFFVLLPSWAQTIKTISVEFTRTVKSNNIIEEIKGSIYYDTTRTTLEVTYPINQWMILKRNTIFIYYPDEKKAIEITSQSPATLPFFQSFVGVVKEDYGLSDFGYTLKRNEVKGDTLFAYWDPPEKVKKVLGQFVLGFTENKIVYTESRYAEGKAMLKATYQDHIKYEVTYFPLKITIIQYLENDDFTIEEVIYNNPIFDKPLPPKVANFKIPPYIKIQKIEW